MQNDMFPELETQVTDKEAPPKRNYVLYYDKEGVRHYLFSRKRRNQYEDAWHWLHLTDAGKRKPQCFTLRGAISACKRWNKRRQSPEVITVSYEEWSL